MSEIHPLRFFSHSRVDADEICRRKRYLGSEWGGTGLSPVRGGWDIIFGDIMHRKLENLAQPGKDNITLNALSARQDTLTAAQDNGMDIPTSQDYAALAEGLLRGFVRQVWWRWMQEYDIVETEVMKKWEVEPGYVFRFKQDILLRNKFDGSLTYVDYKTTSSDSPQWIASWARSPQMHSSMYALKQLGVEVQGCIVQGLFKGWKDKKTGRPTNILTRGWVNREFGMNPQYSYEYKKSKGWESFSTFEEFDDLGDWIAGMPEPILSALFPQTAPIFPRNDIAESYFKQRLIREKEVNDAIIELGLVGDPGWDTDNSDEWIDNILNRTFPQNFSKCKPSFGFACEFEPLCWQNWVKKDPLGSALFVRRDHSYEEEIS